MFSLYDGDFVVRLQTQAQLLRKRRFDDLDIVTFVEEIESLAGD